MSSPNLYPFAGFHKSVHQYEYSSKLAEQRGLKCDLAVFRLLNIDFISLKVGYANLCR